MATSKLLADRKNLRKFRERYDLMRERYLEEGHPEKPVLRAKRKRREDLLGMITEEVMEEFGVVHWEYHGHLSMQLLGKIGSRVKQLYNAVKDDPDQDIIRH